MTGTRATLAVDIGGTGIKASVLDSRGAMLAERIRVETPYPCPPARVVELVAGLAAKLPPFQRVTAGFPGMVRAGRILTAPHFVSRTGPGGPVDKKLLALWNRFNLAAALAKRLGVPAKVANDADIAGVAVVKGRGLELVVTLGTGVGTGMFYDGCLLPHLEFAHHPLRKNATYNEALGEAARDRIGNKRWSKHVRRGIDTLRRLTFFDHCYVGGGNARHLREDLGVDVTLVDNAAGIRGGIVLWERPELGAPLRRTPQ